MKNQSIYDGIVKAWQRLVNWGALAPATVLGLLLVQTQAQAQAPKEPQGFIMACAALVCLSCFVVVGTIAAISACLG